MTSLRRLIPLLVLLTAGCVTPNGGGYSSGGYGKGARDRNAGDIHISWAGYGTHQRVCEATQLVRRDCEDRAHCEVKADNRLCGDPTPGIPKSLRVSYKCHGRKFETEAREGNWVSVHCD